MKGSNISRLVFGEIRGKIIQMLSERPLAFSELQRYLGISSSKLNYHLKTMNKIFISKKGSKYHLTNVGEAFVNLIHRLEPSDTHDDQLKVASVGMVIEAGNIDFNIKEALRRIDLVSSKGIDIICLPFICISKPLAVQRVISPFADKAKDLDTYISFGLFESADSKRYYSTVLTGPRDEVEVYRSIHKNLITVKADIGNNIIVTDTKIGRIGLACGNEYLYPELFRILKLRGADYVVCPTFGVSEEYHSMVQSILTARAIENQLVIALSSSDFFHNRTFATTISPYQAPPLEISVENLSIINISRNAIEHGREYFKLFFPRRGEIYRELTKEDASKRNAAFLFPKKVIRKYEISCNDFVKVEEVSVFERPPGLNIPRTSYVVGGISNKDAYDIKCFDDFGPLHWVITEKDPLIELLTPARTVGVSGKLYSTGFEWKTSEPIKIRGSSIFLNLRFEEYNRLLVECKDLDNEFEVKLVVDPMFNLVTSVPIYSSTVPSQKNMIFTWKWIRPKRIPCLKIELKREDKF